VRPGRGRIDPDQNLARGKIFLVGRVTAKPLIWVNTRLRGVRQVRARNTPGGR
jgi:hypothetical protein